MLAIVKIWEETSSMTIMYFILVLLSVNGNHSVWKARRGHEKVLPEEPTLSASHRQTIICELRK
jgi:hypothetical protein